MVLERHSFLTGGGQKLVDGSAEPVAVGADAKLSGSWPFEVSVGEELQGHGDLKTLAQELQERHGECRRAQAVGDKDASEEFVESDFEVLEIGFVARLEASSSLSASVMPSASVREKPRCSSFLTTPAVSTTKVCIDRQCTIS